MCQTTSWGYSSASDQEIETLAGKLVDQAYAQIRSVLVQLVVCFLSSPLAPRTFMEFEIGLVKGVREFGRLIVEGVVNSLESNDAFALPLDVEFEQDIYRRRNKKTRNQHLLTRFGRIVLWRRGYRSRLPGEPSIFPLEMLLGLTQGASPATTSLLGQLVGSAGMSQQAIIDFAKEHCNFSIGVKRLRRITEALSDSMSEFRQLHQVDTLLEMLEIADKSSGNRKPVLSVGRDGITLRQYADSAYKIATAATISVYNRAGKRLGTVYLGWPPELGQATMDEMITDLLQALFLKHVGNLPRLAYVTDSGASECGYFKNVLSKMLDPHTGKRLEWHRVVDFYHASERIWAMADALFTKREPQQAHAWAVKMLKNLKKPNGASRVLHSAASLFHSRQLGKKRKEKYWQAYNYIRKRTKHLKYADYKNLHIPLGSGVTEAACKTIFTQRLKLSGMRWTLDGARQVITLRTILLSKTWNPTFESYLKSIDPIHLRTYGQNSIERQNIAA